MSEDKDQKTHDPTGKRLEEARKKGDVASAPEMRQAALLGGILLATGSLGLQAMTRLGQALTSLWGNADSIVVAPGGTQTLASALFSTMAAALLPVLACLVAAALVGGLAQGRPTLSWSRVAPKWSKLNPASGAKRLFAMHNLVEFAKTLAKMITVCVVATIVLRPLVPGLDTLVGLTPSAIAATAWQLVGKLLRTVAILSAAIAAFDFVYQRRSWLAKMRMSLQEIKDEHRQEDGDPHIKARIRQIGIQRSRRRMMAAVPEASVVITNPTHYAVALKYDHGRSAAPVVVAKGVDEVALRIRAVAEKAGVPLVENRPLARALYATAEIDRTIPVEHYAAVAEVIGYVLRLARERRQN
ncbi:MAG: flagellar biosynthesis protein FlhB [Sphingomonas sp.]